MTFAGKVVSASKVSDSGGRLYFITGAPGTGKTTLIGSICDIPEYKGRLLVLTAGGGISALSDRDDVATAPVDKFAVMEDARKYLVSKENPYTWVAIDLAPEVYQICLAEVVAGGKATKEGRPTLEARGVANDQFVQMIRNYRVLSETKGINVVFTSHTQETKDDDSGIIIVRANLTPGTLSTVLGIVDVAMYLEIRSKKRQLYLVGNERIWAKARKPLSRGPVTEKIEDPTFEKILKELE